MQMFDGPIVINQFLRQPVEQFGVAGWHAVETEVAGGFYQANTKVRLPHAVHDDSSRHGVIWRCDPVGQRRPTFLIGRVFGQLQQ
jgi:hypothetical protein